MADAPEVDFGPLTDLIGDWHGDRGLDVAPQMDGSEDNPYHETITFEVVGGVKNITGKQTIATLRYLQIVTKKATGAVFHQEVGYWNYDAERNYVAQSLTIPRGFALLAGGDYNGEKDDQGRAVINVGATLDSADWGIVQSPFLRDNGKTKAFKHTVIVGGDTLKYEQTTILDIYGETFDHTDANELTRVS